MKVDKGTVWVIGVMVATFIASISLPTDVLTVDSLPQANVLKGDFGIGAIISLILSAATAAASAGVAGGQAAKAKKERNKAQRTLDNWYENEMAGNILDRADTRSMLSEYRNTMDEQNRKYLQNAIKGGASDEAKIGYAQAANKGYASAISKLAAQGQLRKDRVTDAYMQGNMDASTKMADLYTQSGQQMGNALSQAGSSLSSAVGGMDLGTFSKNATTGKIDFNKPV